MFFDASRMEHSKLICRIILKAHHEPNPKTSKVNKKCLEKGGNRPFELKKRQIKN